MPQPVRTIYLYRDVCGGQNKNQNVIHGLAYWLANDYTELLERIETIFPIHGYSFLPTDHLFGNVQQELKYYKDILLLCEYNAVYSKIGLVRQLNRD